MVIYRIIHEWLLVAVAFAIATFLVSCSGKIATEKINVKNAPVQTVDSMNAVQSEMGIMQMRMSAPLMQRFQKGKESYELFPKGFYVYGYEKDGMLETSIISKGAKHTTGANSEKWCAFGNVVVKNHIKGERIETDTIYWDRDKHMIFTDCYVKLYSQDGFMQGYGLESDERARNAIIKKPFDSYGIVEKDSTDYYIDSVNFIGPMIIKEKKLNLIIKTQNKPKHKSK